MAASAVARNSQRNPMADVAVKHLFQFFIFNPPLTNPALPEING
jgi:hypothetical protein